MVATVDKGGSVGVDATGTVAGMGSIRGSGSDACVIDMGVVAASLVGNGSVTVVAFIAVDDVDAAVVNGTGSGSGA